MGYNLILTEFAQNDFDDLEGSLKKKAVKALRKLREGPEYGEPLGNRYGINLTGFYRLRFNNRKHRIIYRIEKSEIIAIFAIGTREDEAVYRTMSKRILGED